MVSCLMGNRNFAHAVLSAARRPVWRAGKPRRLWIALGGLFLFGLAPLAHAGNWYVDNVASGVNDGTSWASAWTSFANVAWAKISAGDTIYISGGTTNQTYNETLTVQHAGAAGNPVTIKVGQVAGHNGKVIIDAQGTRTPCIDVQGNRYVTVSGNNGSGSTNLICRNATNPGSRYTGVGLEGYGNGLVLEYIEVADCNNGIHLTGSSGMIARNCYLHGIQGDRGIYVAGQQVYDSVQISNCVIQLNENSGTGGEGADGIQGGSGVTVQGCYIYSADGPVVAGQHMDGIQLIGNYWRIVNNVIENMGNACVEGGSVGASWHDVMVYNNVWQLTSNTVPYFMRGFEFSPNSTISAVSNIWMVNNTLVDLNYVAANWLWSGQTPTIGPEVVIANNIFYNIGRDVNRVLYVDSDSGGPQSSYTIDYNDINAGSTGSTVTSINGSPYTEAHPRSGAPTFVRYSAYTSGDDLHLAASDTACIDHGTNGVIWIPAADKDGVMRPQGAAWDIGAFEYNSGRPILNISRATSSTLVLRWPSDVGRSYQAQSSSNLTTWSDAGSAQAGTGQTLSYTVTNSSRMQYFRLRLY
jgi:hypothetical protein